MPRSALCCIHKWERERDYVSVCVVCACVCVCMCVCVCDRENFLVCSYNVFFLQVPEICLSAPYVVQLPDVNKAGTVMWVCVWEYVCECVYSGQLNSCTSASRLKSPWIFSTGTLAGVTMLSTFSPCSLQMSTFPKKIQFHWGSVPIVSMKLIRRANCLWHHYNSYDVTKDHT